MMKKRGRIVNISSAAAYLRPYSNEIQQCFRNTQNLRDLEKLIAEYEVSHIIPDNELAENANIDACPEICKVWHREGKWLADECVWCEP